MSSLTKSVLKFKINALIVFSSSFCTLSSLFCLDIINFSWIKVDGIFEIFYKRENIWSYIGSFLIHSTAFAGLFNNGKSYILFFSFFFRHKKKWNGYVSSVQKKWMLLTKPDTSKSNINLNTSCNLIEGTVSAQSARKSCIETMSSGIWYSYIKLMKR